MTHLHIGRSLGGFCKAGCHESLKQCMAWVCMYIIKGQRCNCKADFGLHVHVGVTDGLIYLYAYMYDN